MEAKAEAPSLPLDIVLGHILPLYEEGFAYSARLVCKQWHERVRLNFIVLQDAKIEATSQSMLAAVIPKLRSIYFNSSTEEHYERLNDCFGSCSPSNRLALQVELPTLRPDGPAVPALSQMLSSGIVSSFQVSGRAVPDLELSRVLESVTRAEKSRSLASLRISSNIVGPLSAAALNKACLHSPLLTFIALSGVRFSGDVRRSVFRSFGQMPALRSLLLCYNTLFTVGGIELADLVISQSPSLQELYLVETDLEATGFAAVAQSLTKSKKLAFLLTDQNGIGSLGMISIAEALKTYQGLTELVFQYETEIEASGVAALASIIQDNPKLTKLGAKFCGIDAAGSALIAAALEKNSTLRSLDLSSNQIDAGGGSELLRALFVNSTLMELDLTQTNVGDELLEKFAQVGTRIPGRKISCT